MRTSGLAGAMRSWLLIGAAPLLVTASLSAQVYWQPQPAPLVGAENEPWFQLGEPISFDGYVYYPAGPRVYFDGNIMVRSGAFRGIPIYTDTTIEAYSRVFVPVSGGMLQPYERRRTGDVAGTTGSRAPSFPVTMTGERSVEEPLVVPTEVDRRRSAPAAAGAEAVTGLAGVRTAPADLIEAGLRPKGLNEIFVTYEGYRWRASGKAVPFAEDRFQAVGSLHGFPVYAERSDGQEPHVIYLPSRAGLVAPYERAGKPPKY